MCVGNRRMPSTTKSSSGEMSPHYTLLPKYSNSLEKFFSLKPTHYRFAFSISTLSVTPLFLLLLVVQCISGVFSITYFSPSSSWHLSLPIALISSLTLSSSHVTASLTNISPRCGVSEFLCSSGECIPDRWVCNNVAECKDSSDEKNCSTKDCKTTDFFCHNATIGFKCIPKNWVCDERKDCYDGSDELDCFMSRTCTKDEFKCLNDNLCIPLTLVCDDKNDCKNGTDEQNCAEKCSENEFRCKDGKCIDKTFRCDQYHDCLDKSDELDCEPHFCSSDQFTCLSDNRCIPLSAKCDDNMDCRDESDELDCPTNTTSKLHHFYPDSFQCKDGSALIPNNFKCDGEKDCRDNSDEKDCIFNTTCPPDRFRCQKTGNCIPKLFRCNGRIECPDESDEIGCHPDLMECEAGQFRCIKARSCIDMSSVCDKINDCEDWSDEPGTLCHINECSESSTNNCTQRCEDDVIGYHCTCEHGYRLHKDGHSCLDIDECSEVFGVCSNHKCFNIQGHYKCECHEGFELVRHRFCRAKGPEVPYFIFANRYDIRKAQLSQSRSSFHHYSRLQDKRSIGIDYNLKENYLVWSDSSSNSIMIGRLSNETSTYARNEPSILVQTDIAHSWGLAIDWIHNLLYWTDEVYATISVVAIKNPQNRITLFDGSTGVHSPRPIAVNTHDRFIVWADWGSHTIEKASQDGSNRKTLLTTDSDGSLSVLSLDMVTKKIYYIDNKLHTLGVLNYDGSGHRVLVSSKDLIPFPFSMDVFEDYIYFSDWKKGAIMRLNVNGEKPQTKALIEHLDEQPMGVKVVHSLKQPSGENLCFKAKCIHLCLPSEATPYYKCVCRHGYDLSSDNFTCTFSSAKVSSTPSLQLSTSSPLVPKSSTASIFVTTVSSMKYSTDKSKSTSENNVLFHDKTKGKEISINNYNNFSDKANEVLNSPSLFSESDTHLAIIISAVCLSILLLIIVLIFVIQRTYKRRHITAMNFDNPVYRKTTEEQFVLEKSDESVHSYPSSLEPLNSPGTNEYV